MEWWLWLIVGWFVREAVLWLDRGWYAWRQHRIGGPE